MRSVVRLYPGPSPTVHLSSLRALSVVEGLVAHSTLFVEIETGTGRIGLGEAGSSSGPLGSTQVVAEQELTLQWPGLKPEYALAAVERYRPR